MQNPARRLHTRLLSGCHGVLFSTLEATYIVTIGGQGYIHGVAVSGEVCTRFCRVVNYYAVRV